MNSYDPIITIKKAFANGGATTLLGCVLFAAFQWFSANGFPTTPEEWKAAWPVILSGIAAAAFAAVKNWAKNRGAIDPDARDPRTGLPPVGPVVILCLIGAAATFSGCAFTRQSVRTMDGDKFSQFAGSTLGKQDSTQKVDADFYPNNTGSHISVGGQSEQDSTAMVPIINALVGALAHGGGGTDGTPDRTRLEKLEAQIEALRRLIEMTRPVEVKP